MSGGLGDLRTRSTTRARNLHTRRRLAAPPPTLEVVRSSRHGRRTGEKRQGSLTRPAQGRVDFLSTGPAARIRNRTACMPKSVPRPGAWEPPPNTDPRSPGVAPAASPACGTSRHPALGRPRLARSEAASRSKMSERSRAVPRDGIAISSRIQKSRELAIADPHPPQPACSHRPALLGTGCMRRAQPQARTSEPRPGRLRRLRAWNQPSRFLDDPTGLFRLSAGCRSGFGYAPHPGAGSLSRSARPSDHIRVTNR